jgi:hypothetical protein
MSGLITIDGGVSQASQRAKSKLELPTRKFADGTEGCDFGSLRASARVWNAINPPSRLS